MSYATPTPGKSPQIFCFVSANPTLFQLKAFR